MNERFIYAVLEQKMQLGNWYWFHNDDRLGDDYEYIDLMHVLNMLGDEGWQLAHSLGNDRYILMKKIV
ncbi:hypothetical protein [Bacillus velezensis]|uniref:hypothetical protein n=1 Tax=Bacillus velezensis TaxID=492670 RepID=UPI001A92EE1A|nr:hypothetical protein [Bacillus velezensis]BCT30440.1 hypothetical protein BVAD3_41140 [Bacillus velezensis]